MNVLVLGSGGREHAIAWKIAQSKHLNKLYVAPGNPGTAYLAENIDIKLDDFARLAEFCIQSKIDYLLVGPEVPLVDGIADYFLQNQSTKHIFVIGPNKESAQLEGSKDFAKDFMLRHKIPTARYKSFSKSSITRAYDFLDTLTPPYVLKADGLAAGKGVLIMNDLDETKSALSEMLNGRFGVAGEIVVIEEFLDGIELSFFVLTDGNDYVILPEAKDYKRIGEGDTGLNTGGMGAVSPVSFVDKDLLQKIEQKIVIPTMAGLKKDDMKYVGFIFIGLMIVENEPYVIEYNVRLGDPETEVILPRLKTDLLEIFEAIKTNQLNTIKIEFEDKKAATVVLVSKGYPEAYNNAKNIEIDTIENSIVFHAGTKYIDEELVTNGGRVFVITSLAENIKLALDSSYKNIENINFEGKRYRKDIGFDLE